MTMYVVVKPVPRTAPTVCFMIKKSLELISRRFQSERTTLRFLIYFSGGCKRHPYLLNS